MTTTTLPAPGRRDLRLLIGATGISTLGDFLALIPLALYIQAQSGSGLVLAGLFIALFAPAVVFAGPAGLIVDRFENRRVIIVVSLVQVAVALALAFATSIPLILALTALMGTGFAIAQPAEFALLPHIAAEDRMTVANGHMETARYLGMTAGPLLGGVLAGAGGMQLALLVDAATFALVALGAFALHARRAPAAPASATEGEERRDRARDGIVFLFADRTLAIVMLVACASLVFMTASMTAEVFFATDVLGAGELGYGALVTAWTLGMVVGAVVVARRVPPGKLVVAALVAVVVQGVGLALPTAWLVLGFALGAFCAGGVGHATKNVLIRTLIHERVPDALRGRAFAAYSGLRNGAELIALAGGGVLVSALGARTTLLVAGAGAVVAGLAGLAAHRALGRRTPPPRLVLRLQSGEAA